MIAECSPLQARRLLGEIDRRIAELPLYR